MSIFFAVAFFHFYAHWFYIQGEHPIHQPILLGLSPISLFVSGLLVFWVWATRLDERRLDYRALTETLRVRRWWSVAGIGRSAADSYLSQLRSKMAWTRRALQSLAPPPVTWRQEFNKLDPKMKVKSIILVRDKWVEKQYNFFNDYSKKHHEGAIMHRRRAAFFAAAGWLLGLMLLILLYFPPFQYGCP